MPKALLKDTLEKKEVVVKADEKVKSSEIMGIMNSAKEAEFTKLILAGEPLSRKEQKNLEAGNQTPAPVQAKPKQQEDKSSNWVE